MTATTAPVRGPQATTPDRVWPWPLAGVLAGMSGLAVSLLVAALFSTRTSPLLAVGDLVIRLTPGQVAESAIQGVGHKDKPLLLTGIVVVLALAFALAGRLARNSWQGPAAVLVALAVVGGVAVAVEHGSTAGDQVPVILGLVTWLVSLSILTEPLRRADLLALAPTRPAAVVPRTPRTTRAAETAQSGGTGEATGRLDRLGADETDGSTRRTFVIRAVVLAVVASAAGGLSRVVGRGRREVEAARASLDLSQVTAPVVPSGATLSVSGISPWQTPASSFYRVDTSLAPPSIQPSDWSLRIHGMVDHEVTLSFQDLLARRFTEAWVTLDCVSNPVGGNYIGNAWWSGVRLADILAEAGPQAGADAVLQTSKDGWTCGTPLSALTDGRNAMLVVAMNGQPLPIDHGFPVRTLVPGLYGYVSACKWVVDMEVTKFSQVDAFWTQRGWSELGPVKMSSRVDVPRSGARVDAGDVTLAGVAWSQHTGISAVQYSLDGGAWTPATLATEPTVDSWVQWSAVAPVQAGRHVVRVRAVDADGAVQTGVQRDVLPNGSTGWAGADFSAA